MEKEPLLGLMLLLSESGQMWEEALEYQLLFVEYMDLNHHGREETTREMRSYQGE